MWVQVVKTDIWHGYKHLDSGAGPPSPYALHPHRTHKLFIRNNITGGEIAILISDLPNSDVSWSTVLSQYALSVMTNLSKLSRGHLALGMVHQWMWPNTFHPGKHLSQKLGLTNFPPLQTCLWEWRQLQIGILARQLHALSSSAYHHNKARGWFLQEDISQEGKEVSECQKRSLWIFEYFPFVT